MVIMQNKRIFINNPLCFGVEFDDINRLDCSWLNPVIENRMITLRNKKQTDRKLIKIRKIARAKGGKRLPKGTIIEESECNVIPYIRATDVKGLRVNVNSAIRIPKSIHKEIQNYQIKKDDVVITIVGVNIGDVGIVEDNIGVCNFTENLAKITVNDDNVLPQFILHFLESELGKIQSERFSVGALQYKLSLQSVRNIEVYLPVSKEIPDLSQQKRILQETFAILRNANNKRELSKKLIEESREVIIKNLQIPFPDKKQMRKTFKKSVSTDPFFRLDALFNHPRRELFKKRLLKYPNVRLGKLIKKNTSGKIVTSDYYRLIELEDIDENSGRIINAREVPSLGSEKVLLQENNILISKLQPEKGKVVVVDKQYDGCVGSSELVPYVLMTDDVTLDYLWLILRSSYILKQWEFAVTGSSRMRIGPTEIDNTIIPKPERKIQDKIVSEAMAKIKQSDTAYQESILFLEKAKEHFLNSIIR